MRSQGQLCHAPDRRQGHAFTLIELLVVIAIIALLAAIFLPALRSALEKGKVAFCQSSLRQLTAAAIMYSDEFNGTLPLSDDAPAPLTAFHWHRALKGYLINAAWDATDLATRARIQKLMTCPSSPQITPSTYVQYGANPSLMPRYRAAWDANKWEGPGYRLARAADRASDLILFFDACVRPTVQYEAQNPCYRLATLNSSLWYTDAAAAADNDLPIELGPNTDGNTVDHRYPRWRHLKDSACNVGFLDGHAETKLLNTVMRRQIRPDKP